MLAQHVAFVCTGLNICTRYVIAHEFKNASDTTQRFDKEKNKMKAKTRNLCSNLAFPFKPCCITCSSNKVNGSTMIFHFQLNLIDQFSSLFETYCGRQAEINNFISCSKCWDWPSPVAAIQRRQRRRRSTGFLQGFSKYVSLQIDKPFILIQVLL